MVIDGKNAKIYIYFASDISPMIVRAYSLVVILFRSFLLAFTGYNILKFKAAFPNHKGGKVQFVLDLFVRPNWKIM